MNKKLITKLIATMLTITLTFANVLLLGNYATKAYATDEDLEKQDIVTKNQNVEFDAYYINNANKTSHSITSNMSAKDLKLELYTKVKKGYLKDIKVSINGKDGSTANFYLSSSNEDMSLIESIDSKNNIVKLKQVSQDSQVVVQIPITANRDDNFNLANFKKQNNVRLEAIYVNDAGKEISIDKTIKTSLEWTETAKATLEQEVLKNKTFEINQEKKLMVQTVVTTGLENNVLPVQETQLKIQVPTVKEIKPESVNVIAKQTLGTNGKDGVEFNKDNWNYDAATGIIEITTKNGNTDNQVSWNKEQKDQYVVTYIFAEEAIQKIEAQEEMIINQKSDLKISTYGSTIQEVSNTANIEINVKEEKGEILTSTLSATMDKFSKGYLYSKISQETSYAVENNVQIDNINLINQILVNNKEDKLVTEQVETSTADYTYFKSTKISKEVFDKILGEEGYIKILDKDGNLIGTISKDNYTYKYEAKYTTIKLETSKPLVEGNLIIEHDKAIVTNINYVNEQIADFQKFRMSSNVQLKNANQDVAYLENIVDVELIEPETKVEAEISNALLSTVVTNENVQIKAILLSNDESCMLYKNPVIEMQFPSFIESIELKEAPQLMYDDELKVSNYEIYTNAVGKKVLKITVTGEDTTYNFDNISKGANVIVNADITLKKLTPTTDSEINVTVTNENGLTRTKNTSTTTSTKIGIKATAPVGLVTTTTVSGYNAKNETINSINAQEQTAKLDVKSEARTAKVEMDIINNYNNVAKDISILGRVPNGNIASLKTMISQTGVDDGKVTIYYSKNADATKDVSLQANGWSTSVRNLADVKSYLVVISDYEMTTGTSIKVSYEINIVANLTYNQLTKAGYTVYFDNVKPEQTIEDIATAANIIFTTGEGPNLTTMIKADVADGQEVQEGSIVKYTAVVRNDGKSRVENVKLSVNIPEKASYFTYEDDERIYNEELREYSQTFDVIEPGEIKTIQVLMEVQPLIVKHEVEEGHDGVIREDSDADEGLDNKQEGEGDILEDVEQVIEEAYLNVKATATVEGYEASFDSSELTNKVIQGYLNVELDTEPVPADIVRSEGDIVEYIANITNVNNIEKENVMAKLVLPEGMTFERANHSGQYNEATRTITWNLGTIKPRASISLLFKLVVDELPENIFEKDYSTKIDLTTAIKDISSNELTIKVQKPALTVSQTTTTPNNVPVGGRIDYNIVVENIGKGAATELKVTDVLPSKLKYEKAQYTYNGKTYEYVIGDNKITISIPNLGVGEKLEINIKAIAQELNKKEEKREVTNIVRVSSNEIDTIEANEITHTIVKNASTEDPSTDGYITEGTYTISGLAWLDADKNGKRDEGEALLSNIQVILISAENGQIVRDTNTNQSKIQYTNTDGQYTFANLQSGKYIVVYFYDTDNYGVTAYQKEGVIDNSSSDAISTNVTYEGVNRKAAATNTIEITTSNMSNIDIGLATIEKFNLSLDKTITKITVNNSKGSKTYDYNNTKLAKLDLNSKYINSTNIIIEYKITVTNIGAVPGYVKKIVDYIPKNMGFNSELNSDWYVSDNGDVYNSSLANAVINPGETKEVKLLLTKKMTEDNTGTINNRAEIYEAYNDFGIADEDSTPANKVSGENDMSSADAAIGVNTGETIVYIAITLISMTILGVGIYLINKKVLRKI